jgi:uncharacterized heparinase superfamily protein
MRISWWIAGLRYRLSRVTARRIGYALLRPWYGSRFYRYTLAGRRPTRLERAPTDMWPGDAGRGTAILQGEFAFAGRTLGLSEPPWDPDGVSRRWRAEAHGFGWIGDLRAVGGDGARMRARELVLDWIKSQSRWQPLTWRPDVLGARIANWLGQSEYLCAGAEEPFRSLFFESLARQSRHLVRSARFANPGSDRIVVLKGLIFAGLAMAPQRRRLARWLRWLEHEIDQQILGDGGHVERSPAVQFAVLRHLIDIRTAIRDAQAEMPPKLQTAIDRMAPMLRFWRHGDGGLALFNDSTEDEGWLIDVALTRAEARGKPLDSAPHSGFERLTANRTLVIMDTGAPPPPGLDSHAHAGTLSVEVSVGKERLVVNCGAHADDTADWRTAQRATAAHSAVTVEDINSAQVLSGGGLGNRPRRVTVNRREADGNTWIDASHDGFTKSLGLVHHRRLYLSANGGDLRGEDTLSGTGNHAFTVRFHLHPTVQASLVQDGSAVLLRTGGGGGWRMRASGGAIGLQESVYLGLGGQVRRSEQIVLSGATQNGQGQVKWAFARLAGRS